MADLQAILAETSKSYDNSRNALNNQINAISGDLAAQQQRINAQYDQQAKSLDNQRNYQAQASSMAASRNGGSFGGANEIANKKYYQQTYVPAVTQMQTNQANDISSSESQANSRRQSLATQLAQLEDQATQTAYSRYDAAKQLEEQQRQFNENLAWQKQQAAQQAALQRAQIAAQNNAYKYMYGGNTSSATNSKYGVYTDNSGQVWYKNNNTGNNVRMGTYVTGLGGNFNSNTKNLLGSGTSQMQELLRWANQNNKTFSQQTKNSYMYDVSKYTGTKRDMANRLNEYGLYVGKL